MHAQSYINVGNVLGHQVRLKSVPVYKHVGTNVSVHYGRLHEVHATPGYRIDPEQAG